ncbi:MAG: hypothetical protein PHE06_16215 [Lachnospiraceae bacterium]|nr:hypothetical protein [Lachnospiraceae bacterium]
MSPILIAIIVFAAIVFLMILQTNISKLQSPKWGLIIPALVLIAAVYAHFFVRVGLTIGSVLIFVIPFLWSLEELYRGRKRRIAETEKEIAKMKAKDML